ncbi:MAG TPA: NADH-quinone oxidoreductase subunit NuoF [Nitrospirae bacterium]|nr:NADH-quinone oxidoreductase subunit NuoF [Nitrospirota bacterium]
MGKFRANLMVCAGSGCVATKSLKVKDAFREELKKRGLEQEIDLILTGCNGFCATGPIVTVYPDNIFYQGIKVEDVPYLVEEHFMKGRPVEKFMYKEPTEKLTIPSMHEIPFFKHQVLRVLRNKGLIDPEQMEEYIARDGYLATAKAVTEMSPEEIIKVIKDSGIRGRGGAGFPTGLKWESCAGVTADRKFMCCNGDEGDPGAFMDRSIMEADPHAVIEGMIIGAKAIGASMGYIYVRAEYPLAVHRLNIAIDAAVEAGFLGKNILDSGFDFDLEVYQGAGAFVCGESTALMYSIEGKRGMPRLTPPRSTESGLWGKPTVLNNVETLAAIPQILLNGAGWFNSLGTEKSAGTKVFSLTGAINNTGLVEVPMGMSIRSILYDIGGGVPGVKRGRKFKAVQMGGPSGGCIPESLIDTPVTFEDIQKTGAIMGSGGMVFMDNTTCMVGMAKFFLEFTAEESCGKCPPCRIGTKIMLDILTDITEGKGKEGDIETLEELSGDIIDGSLCGLGQSAPNPVLTTIKYFRQEYESHIKDNWCKVGICRKLCTFFIDENACKGCGACMRACPSKAIIGEKKKPHRIIQEACIQCKTCFDTCRFKAIIVGPAHYKGDPLALVKK